jgi:hypothetical protein
VVKWVIYLGWEGVDWIRVVQDRDKWPFHVNTVMTFRFLKMQGISWLAEDVSAQEGLYSLDFMF